MRDTDIKKLLFYGLLTLIFCGILGYLNHEDKVNLELTNKQVSVIQDSKFNYDKYIKTATINDKSSKSKVEHNNISTKNLGIFEINYNLKGMNNEKEKTLKVEVKPSVENIVKKLPPEQEAHINENKIFYVKDYPNSDECYKAASNYVLSAGIDCTIEPIFEAGNVIRNPEDIIGYEVKLR